MLALVPFLLPQAEEQEYGRWFPKGNRIAQILLLALRFDRHPADHSCYHPDCTIMKNLNRRDFLKLSTNSLLALAGVLGVGGLIRYLSYEFDSPPRNEFDIGPEVRLPASTAGQSWPISLPSSFTTMMACGP